LVQLCNDNLSKENNRPIGENSPKSGHPGTDVMIFKIFAKKLAVLTQNKGK
jgi:hypothetical protein